MSLLHDTVLTGTSRLHVGRESTGKDAERKLRKSQSHASLLSPLVQLIKDPIGIIGGGRGSLDRVAEEKDESVTELSRKQALQLRMKEAESYEEWKTAATELDTREGNDKWKLENASPEYDTALVAARLKQLDDARISCDVKKMLFLVRTSLTRGLGGMGHLRLYKHSHVGTKRLIERYIDSAQKTLTALLEVSAKQGSECPIEPRVLVEQLLLTRQSFGRSALLLSGGGTFGMNHIGVVKSLWQAHLLPRIISGASAGSIVCAVLCTKIDTEIPEVLEDFCYGDLAVFEKEGEGDGLMNKAARFLKYGSLFDITHLMNVMRGLLGDITFQEAYNRTRRILNITVSSASLYELPRLLNYVTAPNVMIWSAVCASCSVPFVFSAASLIAKDPKTGKEVPWNPTPNAGWIDGSVDNDLPMTRLAEMFNVNHFIVSQVNPHVVPFLAKEEEIVGAEARQASAVSAGPTWMHNIANLAKGETLHRLQVLSELGVFPNYLTKARSILNQRYSGDITIFPSISYTHFPKVLSNPTTEYMLQCMLTGERATWPKLSRIQNHLAIELALDEAIRQLRTRVVFSQSQVDLRLINLNRPLSQGNERFIHSPSSKMPPKMTRFKRGIAPTKLTIPSTSATNIRRITQSRANLSLHATRPYLPTHPVRKHMKSLESSQPGNSTFDTFSSSTNHDGSSSDDEMSDSDTSEVLSSPSPPHSPSFATPDLWSSTRQLFPWASQPTTPSSAALRGYRSTSLLNLSMTSDLNSRVAQPSSPEHRYKHLFHPPPGAPPPETTATAPEHQRDAEGAVQPSDVAFLGFHRAKTVPETKNAAPTSILKMDSFPETKIRVVDNTALLTPALSPLLTRNESKSNTPVPTPKTSNKQESKGRSSSRRASAQGAGLGLPIDFSGTRGMVLRKKRSSISGPPTT